MKVLRKPRPLEDPFTQLPNELLRDGRLSYRARGVLVTLLSHTDGWESSAEALAAAGEGAEGRDAIRRALSELEKFGYLTRERVQDASSGTWSTLWTIHEGPTTDSQSSVNQSSGEATPTTDFQSSETRTSVNQASLEEHQEEPLSTTDSQSSVNQSSASVDEHRQLAEELSRTKAVPIEIAHAALDEIVAQKLARTSLRGLVRTMTPAELHKHARASNDRLTRAAEKCRHDVVNGMKVIGAGPSASRRCGQCEQEHPAPEEPVTANAPTGPPEGREAVIHAPAGERRRSAV